MVRRAVIVLIGLLVLATAVSAQEVVIVTDPLPRIDVRFTEDMSITSALIHRLRDPANERSIAATYDTTKTPDIEYGRSFTLRSTQALVNADYLFEMTIADRVGNSRTVRRRFTITYPETEMRVIRPRLGVSQEAEFDLQIQTLRREAPIDAKCKYASFDPDNDFSAFGLNWFDIPPPDTRARIHQINNYASVAGLAENAPPRPFYMICLDDRDRPNTRRLEMYIDTIAPSITSATFNPATIIEYPVGGGAFESTLTVEASEPVICKYARNETPTYENMTEFDGYNRFLFEAFSGTPNTLLTFPDADRVTYPVTVECEDRAGLRTGPFETSVSVDLSAAIGVRVQSPGRYTSNTTILLSASTQKTSYCSYTLDGGPSTVITAEADPRRTHEADLGDLSIGDHTVSVTCRSGRGGVFQEQTVAHTFTIDTTPPGPVMVTGEPITCEADPVSLPVPLTLSAEDPESGISGFRYTVQATNTMLSGDSISSLPPGSIADNGTSVSVSVHAINNAGLEGPESTVTITVDPTRYACLEHDPPEVSLEETRLAGITTVAVFCEDESGCDNSSIRTGLADSAVNCTAATSYLGPVSVVRTQTLCYYAEDTIGNNVTGSQAITVESSDTCGNGRLDEGEADVDCGGTCGGTCDAGMACAFDADCLSGYCADGTCQSVSCDDGIKNGAESDVDCGGSTCGACGIGQSCSENQDCASNYCSDAGTCEQASCADAVRNGNETDNDCGGANCDACADGMRCRADADCLTGRCSFNFCERELGPAITSPEFPEEEAKEPFGWIKFIFTWGLIVLGLALIGGGSGYLAYTKKGAPPPPPPGLPTMRAARSGTPMPPVLTPQEREAIARRQERIRQKIEKERARKEEERGEALARFGKPVPAAKKIVPEKEAKHALPKEEWLPLEELGKKKAPMPAKVRPEDVDFEKLERLAKKEEDVFERLPEKKATTKEAEDVFARLPKKSAKEKELADKVAVDRLEELGAMVGGEVFEELEKKSAKKKPKKRK